MMRFASGNNPVEFLNAAGPSMQGLLRRTCAKRELIFVFGAMRERFDSGSKAKFAGRHAESQVNLLGRNGARANDGAGTRQAYLYSCSRRASG